MFGGGLGMLLLWLVPVALAIWLFTSGKSRSRPADETALDILKKRYAWGEIGQEEFDRKKRESSA